MLVVQATPKLRTRVSHEAADDDVSSTTVLGDWYATVLFWRPQVALFVNTTSRLPVYVPFSPSADLFDRAPDAIAETLLRLGMEPAAVADERAAMSDVRLRTVEDPEVDDVLQTWDAIASIWGRGRELPDLGVYLARASLDTPRRAIDVAGLHITTLPGPAELDGPLAEVIPFPRRDPRAR